MQSGAPKVHSETERAQMWSTIQKNIPAQPTAERKPAARTKRLGIAGMALIAFFGAAAFTSAVIYVNRPDPAPQTVRNMPAVYPPHRPVEVEMIHDEPEPVQAETKVPEAGVLGSTFSAAPTADASDRGVLSASAAPAVAPAEVFTATESAALGETPVTEADSARAVSAPPVQEAAKAEKVPVVVKKPVVVNNEEVKVVKVKSKFSKQAK